MPITKPLGVTPPLHRPDNRKAVVMATFGQGRPVSVVRLSPKGIVSATNMVGVTRSLATKAIPTSGT